MPSRLALLFVMLFAGAACAAGARDGVGAIDEASTIHVTSKLASGPGSLREAIEVANESTKAARIVSDLDDGAVVYVFREMPAVTGFGTELDLTGLTLKGGSCRRADGRKGCSGLVIAGPRVRVRGLSATGFLFDGISVRGGALDVRIEECHAHGNQDDGVGISGGATGVVVESCLLENNGFRTKGKGILVFDYSEAVLRDNTVRSNRDGVTVSRGARARLTGNRIVDNFDKGFGVIGAEASGSGNIIARNGLTGPEGKGGPNADGVRVTADSTLELTDTTITDNGDVGLVVTGMSSVSLTGGRIGSNRGGGVNVRDNALVELRGVDVGSNGRGEFSIEGQGRLVRTGSDDEAYEAYEAAASPSLVLD